MKHYDLDNINLSQSAIERWQVMAARAAKWAKKYKIVPKDIGTEYLAVMRNGTAQVRCKVGGKIFAMTLRPDEWVMRGN